MNPFQKDKAVVRCNHFEKDKHNEWTMCNNEVTIQGLQSEWPKCVNGHTIKCPDQYFCWTPAKCINARYCQALRACND